MSEYGYGHMIAENMGKEADEKRRHDYALQDEQRQAQLANIGNAGLTPEAQAQAIHTLYAKDPSALKRHVENLMGRMAGKKPQPTPAAYPAQSATVGEAPLQVGGGMASSAPPAPQSSSGGVSQPPGAQWAK